MEHTPNDTRSHPSGAHGAGGGDPVDVQALADRVYRLFVAELRLERARGSQPTARE